MKKIIILGVISAVLVPTLALSDSCSKIIDHLVSDQTYDFTLRDSTDSKIGDVKVRFVEKESCLVFGNSPGFGDVIIDGNYIIVISER